MSSLIWLIAIIGIELSDPGPVFYLANRIGKNGKEFKMFKFRSMRVAKEANEKSFKADTERIFKFGKFLRSVILHIIVEIFSAPANSFGYSYHTNARKEAVFLPQYENVYIFRFHLFSR